MMTEGQLVFAAALLVSLGIRLLLWDHTGWGLLPLLAGAALAVRAR